MVTAPLQRGLAAQVALCGALLAAILAMPARVQAASQATVATQWVVLHGARVRLIAGPAAGSAKGYLAGIELELTEGWKTYWRSPGDAGGMPPVFDWDQSKNLGKAVLLYPVPERFADPEGVSVGYKKHVVFPIEITASGSAPVELVLPTNDLHARVAGHVLTRRGLPPTDDCRDADVVVTIAAADAALDPTVAFMQGKLKSTGSTAALFEVLRNGDAAAAISRLASRP